LKALNNDTNKVKMSQPKNYAKISKFLSLLLRHKPEAIDLTLDEHGWASVAELIEKARP